MNAKCVAQVADRNGDEPSGSTILSGFDIKVLAIIRPMRMDAASA
jgi:hypothetical protein